MGKSHTDPGARILRRVKRRRAHLSRLLAVIRAFRRHRRTPPHCAVASQHLVRVESTRSFRTALEVLLRDQWRLRRSLDEAVIRRADPVTWATELSFLRRRIRFHDRPRTMAPAPPWEKPLTDRDLPLQIVGFLCGGIVATLGLMGLAMAFA